MLREKCVVLNVYIAKERRFQLKMQEKKDIKERQEQKKKKISAIKMDNKKESVKLKGFLRSIKLINLQLDRSRKTNNHY